jgi:hypothetical protein
MNLTINGKAIRKQTLIVLGVIVAGAASSQIAAVNHFLSYHPHLEPIGGFVLTAIALLHNPAIEQLIFQQHVETPAATTDTTITVAGKDAVLPPKSDPISLP